MDGKKNDSIIRRLFVGRDILLVVRGGHVMVFYNVEKKKMIFLGVRA
jgi:hypothetical protein